MNHHSKQPPPTYEEACHNPTVIATIPSRGSSLRNLVLRSRGRTHSTSSSSTSNPGPAPTPQPTEKAPSPSDDPIKELASKTPQWLWSQTECKEWLKAIFVYYLDYSEEHAEEILARMKGFGPSIFGRTEMDWRALVGNEVDGSAIHALVFSMRKSDGAVPQGISFGHWS